MRSGPDGALARARNRLAAQFAALSSRLFRNTYRHPFLVTVNFTATLFAAIALGLIFYDSGARVPRALRPDPPLARSLASKPMPLAHARSIPSFPRLLRSPHCPHTPRLLGS